MSRPLKILAMTVGGISIFALFALAGWAIVDQMDGNDIDDVLDTVAMTEYPLQPAADDIEGQFEQLGAEQILTEEGLSGTSNERISDTIQTEDSLGAASAGGQTVRLVDQSTSDTSPDTGEDSDAARGEDVPTDLFEDMPRLLGGLDLPDVLVADPVGPILIDLCAGPERLPETPEGCSFGFGGTILTVDFDDDPTYAVAVFLASEGRCEASDDTMMSLVVATAVPGTVFLTLWQGAPDSDPPPGAFFAQYETPAELTATLTAELDAGDATTGFFCIEVPEMTGELVAESFLVSSYPAHGGAPGPVFRYPLTVRSGRPPSAMTAFGSDALYVRNHRSDDEQAWVKAVEIELGTPPGAVCNTGGREIGARGPTPNGMPEADVVGSLVYSTSIEIDAAWPYDERFTTVDVHLLNLEAAQNYAVCSYVVSTDPFGEVVHSEAGVVGTPTSRGIAVKLVGAGGTGESSVALVGFELATPCGTFPIDYPGPGVDVEYDHNICRADFLVSDVIRDGGFAVTIHTRTSEDREDAVTHGWIPVDHTDILCGTACDGDREFVVRLPVRGFDLTESGRTTASVGYLDLVVTLTAADPGGSTTWDLGTADAYDNTNPELPEHPRVSGRLLSTPVTVDENGTPLAGMSIQISADRPVSFSLTVDPTFPTCGLETPITTTTGETRPGSIAPVSLAGLCIGVLYPVTIDAVDEFGNRTMATREFYADSSQTLTLRAELQLESLPSQGDIWDWHQTFRNLTAIHSPSWPVRGAAGGVYDSIGFGPFSVVVPPGAEGVSPEPETTQWKIATNEGFYGQNICDGDIRPPFARTWEIVNVPIRSLDWSFSTRVLRARYSAEFEGRACQPNRSNSSAPLNIEFLGEVRIAAPGLTLEDLIQSVVITTETAYGTAAMRVWAELN